MSDETILKVRNLSVDFPIQKSVVHAVKDVSFDLKRGETAVVSDAREDPRTAATAPMLEAISARSFINMPVTEQGDFVALLFLNHNQAREWTHDELALVREFAERTRTAVARLDAEKALRRLAASLEQQVEERTAEWDRVWRNSRETAASHVQALQEKGVDTYDIPAFLRKQAD